MESTERESAYCSGEEECCESESTRELREEVEDIFSVGLGLFCPRPQEELEVDVAIIGKSKRCTFRLLSLSHSGNGPSAIFLSLLLSGHRPYFNGRHPNDILKRKLSENVGKSLLEQVIH